MLQVKSPIYIVSKGRAYNPKTAKIFLTNNIPFKIAIEEQEYNEYAKVIPKECIAVLPFSNLGLGSYPARNWCWTDSIKNGHSHHFIFDDNIYCFVRLQNGERIRYYNPHEALNCLETFAFQYSNLAIAGYNYTGFLTKQTPKAFFLNCHVYSGMLIRNDIPFRWRLKYNEDVDLCLQALHNKWCTVSLNVFTINKTSTTAKQKGGNQTELYQNNDIRKKALKSYSLQKIWPQYVRVVMKYNRPHHQVSWGKFFKQPLIKYKNSEHVTKHDQISDLHTQQRTMGQQSDSPIIG